MRSLLDPGLEHGKVPNSDFEIVAFQLRCRPVPVTIPTFLGVGGERGFEGITRPTSGIRASSIRPIFPGSGRLRFDYVISEFENPETRISHERDFLFVILRMYPENNVDGLILTPSSSPAITFERIGYCLLCREEKERLVEAHDATEPRVITLV